MVQRGASAEAAPYLRSAHFRWALLRDPGKRFDPQALPCTDLVQEPLQIVR